jgi:D-methionine transport system substrate-binding protein
MKKITSIILALVLVFSLAALSACGSKTTSASSTDTAAASAAPSASSDDKTITVGASAVPHAEILAQVKDTLAAQGYTLNIVTFDDYVLPNKALADGELDANYFQHKPYLDNYNKENGTNLVSAAAIHYEPFGIFGNGITDLKDLKAGATILIPADGSNETRALFLLQQVGLIKLPENADAAAGVTTLDVKDNGGYNIQTVQADTVAAQLKNSDKGTIAVINGNYALEAGLKITDALATEDASGTAAQTYANIIAVRSGDENSAKIKALIAALETSAVKDYITKTYNGAVVAIF